MAKEPGPNLGLVAHFGSGADGWDGDMDANLDMLDALVALAVLADNLTAPPAQPNNGDRYIVAANATGAWAGHDGAVAVYRDTAWKFYAPVLGLRVLNLSTVAFSFFGSAGWVLESQNGGGGGGGLADAPNDGAVYARKNGAWVQIDVDSTPAPLPSGDPVQARYWRINNLYAQKGGYVGTAELVFYDAAGNVIPSSAPFSNGSDTDPLANVNDGNPATYWTTNAAHGGGFVGVDLGSDQAEPHSFSLLPRPDYLDSQSIWKGTLEYSTDDKQSWTVVRSFEADTPWTANDQKQTFTALATKPDASLKTGRYWRVDNLFNTVNGANASYVGTGELTFYDLAGKALASFSPFSNGNDTDPVANVNDGDPTTAWTSGSVDGTAYVGVDLGSDVQVGSVSLTPRNDGLNFTITKFGVSCSENKSFWTPVKQNIQTDPWTQNSQVQTFNVQG